MSTPKREALERLLREAENTQPVDEAARERLEQIKHELRQALDRPDDEAFDHEPLVERLNDALLELEADHPSLASAMNVVISTLSNLGI